MTDAQRTNFFMPKWNACCRANGWHMHDHAAAVDADRLTEEGRKILTLARQRAAREFRPMTLRDMRHGCYILALGRDKQTEALTNADQDRIVALFNLLRDPSSLAAIAEWQAYQRGENPGATKRQKYFIQSRAPEAVARHLTYDLTGGRTRDPESLNDEERKTLARLLAQRRDYRKPVKQERTERIEKKETECCASVSSVSSCKKPNPKNYVLKPQLMFTKGPF